MSTNTRDIVKQLKNAGQAFDSTAVPASLLRQIEQDIPETLAAPHADRESVAEDCEPRVDGSPLGPRRLFAVLRGGAPRPVRLLVPVAAAAALVILGSSFLFELREPPSPRQADSRREVDPDAVSETLTPPPGLGPPRAEDKEASASISGPPSGSRQELASTESRVRSPSSPSAVAEIADTAGASLERSGSADRAAVNRESLAGDPAAEAASPAEGAPSGKTVPKKPRLAARDSYLVVTRALEANQLPPAGSVRINELVNAFDYGDSMPSRRDLLVTAQGGPSPFRPQAQVLRFAIQTRPVDTRRRKPISLTLVIEAPVSATFHPNFHFARRALESLFDELGPGDRVGTVVYGLGSRVVNQPTTDLKQARNSLRRALLHPVGTLRSDLEPALELAAEMAARSYREEATNTLLIVFQSNPNDSHRAADSIDALARASSMPKLRLEALGLRAPELDDVLAKAVEQQGGSVEYAFSVADAGRWLARLLVEDEQPIAYEAKAIARFNPEIVRRWQPLSTTSPPVSGTFVDEFAMASELVAGDTANFLYEVELEPGAPTGSEVATVSLHYLAADIGATRTDEERLRVRDLSHSALKAPMGLRLGAVAAELGGVLSASPWATETDVLKLRQTGRELLLPNPNQNFGDDIARLLDLMDRLAELQ